MYTIYINGELVAKEVEESYAFFAALLVQAGSSPARFEKDGEDVAVFTTDRGWMFYPRHWDL